MSPMFTRNLLSRSILLFLTGASVASAQEACIICNGPDQVYLCSVEKSDKVQKLGVAEKAVQFVCITEMARLGGHSTCKVRRDVDTSYCSGVPHTVSLANLLDATAEQAKQAEAAAKAAPTVAANPAPVKPPPGSSPPDAPKTMVELARRTSEQSSQQVKQAGKQVGGAVQKTWDCMVSLFQRC
jgi:hypothetical protein